MKKIYFILLLTVVTRLYHFNFPLIGWHSWRQTDTASIAKNFYENGFNLLYPQVQWSGNTAGYVESEFQIYPFIVSLLYKLFGTDDSIGRLLSIIFSVFTVYGLYLLVKAVIDKKTALWSSFIYAVLPLNIYFGRAFMPESMMLMCLVFGVYFFYKWTTIGNLRFYIYSLLFITLAVLIKIPCFYIGLPLLYLSYKKYRWKSFLNPHLLIYTFIIMLCTFLWYQHAHNLYKLTGLTFNIWGFGSDKWGNLDLILSADFYYNVFIKTIADRHLVSVGFIILIIGLYCARKYKTYLLFCIWLLSLLIYIIIAAGGNMSHDYYQLPFTLPASVYIGHVFSEYLSKQNAHKRTVRITLIASLVLILAFSAIKTISLFLKEDPESTILTFTDDLKRHTKKEDLIVNFSEGTPTNLYLSDRKGWVIFPEKIADTISINNLKSKGAKYLAGEKRYYNSPELMQKLNDSYLKYDVLVNEKDYFILSLEK